MSEWFYPQEVINRTRLEWKRRDDEAYKAWIARVTTLSVGALTLLVSLQDSYVPKAPEVPQWKWLLLVSWALLTLAVIAGLVAAGGESILRLSWAARLNDEAQKLIDREEAAWNAERASGRRAPLGTDQSALESRARTIEIEAAISLLRDRRPWLFRWAAFVAFSSLCLGLAAVAAFAIRNHW